MGARGVPAVPLWSWGRPDVESTAESATWEARAGEGRRRLDSTGVAAALGRPPGLASPRSSLLWTRPDGQQRQLEHLGGPPADVEAEGPWARRLDALDACLPGWDDALFVGVLVALVTVLLAQLA